LKTVRAAVQRGDRFEVWVNEAPDFASALVALRFEAAAKVCQALAGNQASVKLIATEPGKGCRCDQQ
jgi:hypothetical protein